MHALYSCFVSITLAPLSPKRAPVRTNRAKGVRVNSFLFRNVSGSRTCARTTLGPSVAVVTHRGTEVESNPCERSPDAK